MPKRIHCKRTKGWRMPENAVYVGRPSKWGNPFTGPDALEKYKDAISTPLTLDKLMEWRKNERAVGILDVLVGLLKKEESLLVELRGKDLACWCPLDKPCHADILLEIANGDKE